MKLSKLTFACCLFLSFCFSGCLKDQCDGTSTFIQWSPVYKTLAEIRADINIEAPRALKNPGKLYFYGDYVLINERNEGVHIIDNRDAANPQNISFLAIPGNVDMAVKDGFLYADNYIDLLTISIQNPKAPTLVKRTEDVFVAQGVHPELGLLVDYIQEEVTLEINCNDPRSGQDWFWQDDLVFSNAEADVALPTAPASSGGGQSGGAAPATGIGGSFARFTLYDNYLYTVDQTSLRVFEIDSDACPNFRNTVRVGWGIETIFPLKDKLFIGSNNGMFIYDVQNPLSPRQLSQFEHARACDPVFVKEDIAFVTLRDGNTCQGFVNQLDIIDVSNLTEPRLLFTHQMDNPHGLSVKDNTLFLCEGDFGFKIYDVADLARVKDNLIHHKKDFQAYDVIALPNKDVVMVIGSDGFYQFDSSNLKSLKELSIIPVERD